jgi:3-oxoacyl-[acyl-carrier protein] reductase
MSNLDKKIALVTGASRGIGRATAVAHPNGGARVIIHYGRSASEAESLRKQIDAAGGDADIVSADLAAPDGPANLAKQVRGIAGEKLDILVANAGIGKAAPIEEHTIEDFEPRLRLTSGRLSSSCNSCCPCSQRTQASC